MAKDAAMASHLTKSFAQQEIQKVYFGMSAKRPTKKKQGWVQGGMVRSRDKSWILTRDSKSNFAKTRFFTANVNVNVHVDDDSTTNTTTTRKYTAILFRPYTGKTHQLRVAAKAMGIPLLGDPIYKDGIDHYHNNNNDNDDDIPTITRTYLHASGICIPALDGHASVTVWSPPPFEALLGDDDDEDDSMMTNVVQKLMIKHCDVPSLVEAMMEG
jgi:23S rRNA-/tRNA-specific pseudouridylate synthase